MPNSLATSHPSALVYSTRPRVSVYGTAAPQVKLSGFSRRHAYPRCHRRPEPAAYCQVRLGGCTSLPPSAPTPFNPQFRLRAEVSLPRHRVAARASSGMLTASSIGIAFRLILRHRLTPGRLTSPGNPWPYGGGESHPPYRYLYLHLLFQTLQQRSRAAFTATGMLPYRQIHVPRLRCAAYTRLLSMPDSSTSELLRTL